MNTCIICKQKKEEVNEFRCPITIEGGENLGAPASLNEKVVFVCQDCMNAQTFAQIESTVVDYVTRTHGLDELGEKIIEQQSKKIKKALKGLGKIGKIKLL